MKIHVVEWYGVMAISDVNWHGTDMSIGTGTYEVQFFRTQKGTIPTNSFL